MAARRYKAIVFATGAFDLLHPGHIHFLTKAKAAGDMLVVGVESDQKVREAKGHDRPILAQKDRAALVSALYSVDRVIALPYISDNRQYQKICEQVGCHILAVTAGDPYLVKKRAIMQALGGTVRIVTKRIGIHSSSALVHKARRAFL